jgi:hypothetical protein
MKQLALKTLTVLLAAVTVSCAKKLESTSTGSTQVVFPNNGTPYIPPTTGPGYNPGQSFGASAPLSITNLNVMSEYTTRPMYSPQQIELNLNLKKYGNSFGGTARISYTDYGQRYEGFFTSGHSAQETQYNVWFKSAGKDVWHGFFEDYLGAIVVVIDNKIDLGDGGADSKVSGSVWFKNFGYTYAPRPPAWCWFVSLGPYDCRAWKNGEGVSTTRAVNPDNGYVRLGTFSDMDLKKAFNGEVK